MVLRRCLAVCFVAVALLSVAHIARAADDDDGDDGMYMGEEYGGRRVCGQGSAFRAAVPAFLEHCSTMVSSNVACTALCNAAFMAISKYPSCLRALEEADMEDTPELPGLKPEDALSLTFMMAFSRCHTAALLPSGPTSPLSKSKCDAVLMTQFEADIVNPFLSSCKDLSESCSEACSHFNSMLRRHPCFPPYFHSLRRSSGVQSAASQAQALSAVQTANRVCALSTNNLKMIQDMCSEENLLRFQDLTWVNFLRACHSTYHASLNPWQAHGKDAEAKHEHVKAAELPAPKKDKTCHAQCKESLLMVLSDEYCLQRFEENMAAHGDKGATSLLADVLDMCDETRKETPQYGVQTDTSGLNNAAGEGTAPGMRLLFLSCLSTLLAVVFGFQCVIDALAA